MLIANQRMISEERYLGNVASQHELILHRRKWKDNGQRVVLVCGCFDLLHPGHVRLLERARSLGDVLVVAIRDDVSVRKDAAYAVTAREGARRISPHRPITPGA